jgi:hypothetical protein
VKVFFVHFAHGKEPVWLAANTRQEACVRISLQGIAGDDEATEVTEVSNFIEELLRQSLPGREIK